MLSKRIATIVHKGSKDFFEVSRHDEEAFLKKLGPAKDDFDRSYKQYLCQNFLLPKWKVIFLNIIALFSLIPIFIFLLIKRVAVKREEKVQAIGDFEGITEIIPAILHEKYQITIQGLLRTSLSISDLPIFLKMVVRFPFSPYFTLKCTIRLGAYSQAIYSYQPEAIIVHNEPTFTSSVLTYYCEKNRVKHIDVMHGEKLFYIRDSYFRFDECYVWSEHYIKLFVSLCAAPDQFIVAIPPSLVVETGKYTNTEAFADYKYYLSVYTEQQLISIINSLQHFKENGKTVRYRPHPRYSDIPLLRKYVDEKEIEIPSNIDILTSVSNLKYAVGSFSTVLTQAYFSGKGVILDDVTFADQYYKLSDLGYFFSGMDLPVLSSYKKC